MGSDSEGVIVRETGCGHKESQEYGVHRVSEVWGARGLRSVGVHGVSGLGAYRVSGVGVQRISGLWGTQGLRSWGTEVLRTVGYTGSQNFLFSFPANQNNKYSIKMR